MLETPGSCRVWCVASRSKPIRCMRSSHESPWPWFSCIEHLKQQAEPRALCNVPWSIPSKQLSACQLTPESPFRRCIGESVAIGVRKAGNLAEVIIGKQKCTHMQSGFFSSLNESRINCNITPASQLTAMARDSCRPVS